jgi:hypothetical protein
MEKGDIVTLKTTGEKVVLLAHKPGCWDVRRPNVNKDGGVNHELETFMEIELESIDAFTDRSIKEMKMRARKQKELLKEEQAVVEELEAENLERELASVTTEKVVPFKN